ncbi:MAG: hypothetical protein PVJ38_00030 [Candidatus Bathyarchaeota archaeon]|jgi:hypothetical protein
MCLLTVSGSSIHGREEYTPVIVDIPQIAPFREGLDATVQISATQMEDVSLRGRL